MKSNSFPSIVKRLRDCLEYLGARPWLSFFLIFSLAAVLRFAILSTLPASWPRQHAEAGNIAVTLATEGRFADPFGVPTGPSAHNPPFYPFFLSLVYRVLGTGLAGDWARCAIGILAYSILFGLLPRLATLFGLSGAAGVLGGFALAALPLRKSSEVSSWEDPYAAIALAFLLVWTLRLKRQSAPSWRQAALYGLCWGALFYMTPTPVVTFLGLAAYLFFSWQDRWRSLRWLTVAMLLAVLAVSPWTLRNRRELGGWMFMRSNLGLELYYANNDEAQPTIGLNNRFELHRPDPSSGEEARRVARLGELAYNREKLALAEAWIAGHPGRFVRLSAMRAAAMWFGAYEEPWWMRPPIAVFTLLGLVGLTTLWRGSNRDQFAVIGILWLTYPSVYFVFQYCNRYRGVFDWSIALCLGVFLMSVLDRFGSTDDRGATRSNAA